MARPSKLTPEVQEKIVSAIRAGNYLHTAAAYAGITYTTLDSWMNRGEKAKSDPYRRFWVAVLRAQAEAEVRDVAIIGKAAQEQWHAAAWRLERKFPDRWGRRQHTEISGPDGGPIQVERVGDAIVEAFQRRQAAEGNQADEA